MPNWTLNRIDIEGDDADIREFLDAVRSQDQLFDFNRIIPMPELLRSTAYGHKVIDGEKVSSWYVIREGSRDVPEKVRLFTPEDIAALAEIGSSNWYEWSIANWGTKSNACDVMIDAVPRYVEISFHTAWDAPIPVLRKTIAKFPKLAFDCHWRDEGDDREVYLVLDPEESDE